MLLVVRAIRRFSVRTVLPAPIAALDELASNLRWSWHPPTQDLFAELDPARWKTGRQDPVALLGALSSDQLTELAGDTGFVARVDALAADLRTYLEQPRWYQTYAQEQAAAGVPRAIAYFSAEFGITAVLPQYSGGLGILAGDHLKAASDLGAPVVGVGLFYKTGYFKQSLSREGWQHEDYPILDPDGLPLALLREVDGTPCDVVVALPGGRQLVAHVWKAQVGRVPLLLLDSDVEANDEAARGITDRLYGGSGEHRLQQEMLLGIGGVRALRLWSRLTGAPTPDVYHANEGHAGLMGIERIRELVEAEAMSFAEALEAVRAATVFTTHTPVPAGIDRFGTDQIRTHFGGDNAMAEVPVEQLIALGAEDYPGGEAGVFNMAVMGLRLGQRANAVSQLHGEVSRNMFDGLWPGFDDREVPISSITNGVHAPTWVDRRMFELAGRHTGDAIDESVAWDDVAQVPVDAIWAVRRQMREQLVLEARRRLRSSWLKRGVSRAELGWVDSVLDPDVLTIGFARRVPTYKRLTLMLREPDRLTAMLLDPDRPVQLIIAGKSHPADDKGKSLIQQIVRFADDPAVRHRIIFLPNYDIAMAQYLYPGCDVWLNNPLRPFEACGTSGMKSALNGGLNLSILDGWWDEWFDGQNGWAIPTADGVEDPDRRDDIEAAALYDLIQGQVAPRFYDRDEQTGLPSRWLEMVSHTLRTLGPKVLASRMVKDYIEQLYTPAARAGWAMAGAGYPGARDLAGWKARVRTQWPAVRVDHVESLGVSDSPQVGDVLSVRAFVSLEGLSVPDVQVQLMHGRVSETDELADTQSVLLAHVETYEGGRHLFEGDLRLSRTGAFGYTVRVLPAHPGLANATELGLVANA